MADTKITALTALTAADPANDVIPIVDVSDTSMAASGTTKKISVNNILGASGTATLASATITGDLTVDTNVLKVDSTLNKVGIGVATLTGLSTLNVAGDVAITSDLVLKNGSGTAQGYIFGSSGINYRVIASNPHVWQEGGTDLMRLNSTGLGIGDAPATNSRLTIGTTNATGFQYALRTTGITTGRCQIYLNNTSGDFVGGIESSVAGSSITGTAAYSSYVGTSTANPFHIATNGSVKATVDSSGNLLVGTTSALAAWATRLTLSTDAGTTKWAVGPYAAATNFIISADGGYGVYLNGTTATSWTGISDERLKDIIEPISNAVAKVGQLRSVIGKFKSDETNTRRSFLIAQDVQAVLPEAVDASNPDRLGVAYTEVIPLLVAAIKELTARVQTLEAR